MKVLIAFEESQTVCKAFRAGAATDEIQGGDRGDVGFGSTGR